MPTHLEKFRDLLKELFQLDQADLDFGIYRIMNQKRDEIIRFLDKDLLPQVQAAFAEYQAVDKSALQSQIDEALKQAQSLGVDAEQSPKVKALRQKMAAEAVDIASLENTVFSHLFNFFRRYYQDGDFISLRRYKEGVYAIPYEGEEVKLYWANHDQYYIKSSETFRDYTFKLESGKRITLQIVAASTEQNNNKAASGKERRFVLCAEHPLREENGELHIRFEYRPSEGREKQSDLNAQAIAAILNAQGFDAWTAQLAKPAPTENDSTRTVLAKHLAKFTARNEFDYFIHKDLGGFLRRELDFYIKNEVMHLDDIENDSAPRVEQYLSLIKVIRKIAHKIITFLAQLENFQKKLWLKKKFVLETHYGMTLDRVPEDLYAEIAANDAQREEWVKLFAIDEIKAERLGEVAYSKPLTVEFLKSQPHLVLDTRHFPDSFKQKLLASIDDLDEKLDGLLIHSENFQALQLMGERYREKIDCVYIDPPYNSKTSEIAYKNGFKHSSWASLIQNRLAASDKLAGSEGCHVVAIDENEQELLGRVLSEVFASAERVCVSLVHNKKGIQGRYFSQNHEFAYFCIPPCVRGTNARAIGESDWDFDNLRKWGRESERETARNCFYPIYVRDGDIVGFGEVAPPDYHPPAANVQGAGVIAVYPIDSGGVERKWRYARDSVEGIRGLLRVHTVASSGEVQITKARSRENLKTVWDDPRYIAGDHGTKWLTNLGIKIAENIYPKSIHSVQDSIFAVSGDDAKVLDYFAGSGTTAHAVINLNREDDGHRKYILVEMGEYFHTVLLPRIKKVVYSKDWKDGKPTARDTGISHGFKYLRLESYEDALNNLQLQRTQAQEDLLNSGSAMREQYMLSYILDVESRGSPSLLNIDQFRNPDQYQLKVEKHGETQPVHVDLPETFNWLLGLTVRHIDVIRGVRVISGTNPKGDRVLVLWRNIDQMDNDKLDAWFRKQGYNTREMEYDIFYVNGDNNLENLRRADQTWKVRLIEEEFRRLMFEAGD